MTEESSVEQSSKNNFLKLRPEARPLPVYLLSDFQLKALNRIAEAFKEALDDASRADGLGAGTCLDRTKASRIFLLSGEPGSGKTTAYLTLRYALEWASSNRSELAEHRESFDPFQHIDRLADGERPGGETNGGEELIDKRENAEGLKKRVEELAPRRAQGEIIWLEPLNLEVANKSSNYLAAVLARIDRALAHRLDMPSSSERRGVDRWSEPHVGKVLEEFQRIRTDIGLSWDGSMPSRGEHLDPDVFAEEVMRAEDARIGLNRRLHDCLAKLTKELYTPGSLFVLPVDDLYLVSGPSLDLLRLLRLISLPNLFILAIGEEEVLLDFIHQRQLGDMIRQSGDVSNGTFYDRIVAPRARQITHETTRKLLPMAQRAMLQAVYWHEALFVNPHELNGTSQGAGDASLGHFLSRKKMSLDEETLTLSKFANRKVSLLKFLLEPGEPGIQESDLGNTESRPAMTGLEHAYTGMQILEAPWRNLMDLWLDCQKTSDQAKDHLSWIYRHTLASLGEQQFMSADDVTACEDVFQGSLYVDRRLDTRTLQVKPEVGCPISEHPGKSKQGQDRKHVFPTLEGAAHKRWITRPDKSSSGAQDNDPLGIMPSRPQAWLFLFHDILVLADRQRLIGPPLTPEWKKHQWMGCRWRHSFDDPWNEDSSVFVPWILPRWPSFWHFDRFLCQWNIFLESDISEDGQYWENTPAEVPEEVSKEVPEEVSKEVPEEVSKEVPEKVSKEVPEKVFDKWLGLVLDVFELPEHLGSEESQSPSRKTKNEPWERLKHMLGEPTKKPKESTKKPERPTKLGHIFHHWLIALAAMAVGPEFGIPSKARELVRDAVREVVPMEDDSDVQRRIQEIRARSLIQFMEPADDSSSLRVKTKWADSTDFLGKTDLKGEFIPDEQLLQKVYEQSLPHKPSKESIEVLMKNGSISIE